MATRIIEYPAQARGDRLPIYPQSLVEQTAMTATGTSAQSAAFGAGTSFICIDTDEQIYIKLGTNPTATTNCRRIPAGSCIEINAAEGQKVAIRT